MSVSRSDAPVGACYPARAPIDAYGNGGFRFAGMSHKGSILCLPDAIVAWDATDLERLTPSHLAGLLDRRADVDFALLGTGVTHLQPPAWVRAAFAAAGIGLDVMATGAAARTWNVLIAEGRSVAAALMAVN